MTMDSLPVLHQEQVREVDRLAIEQYGMSGLVLMENAGRGCADVLCRLQARGPVVICCGSGNNAGDGLVLARHLELRGIPVRVLFCSDPEKLRGEAAANWQIARAAELPMFVLDETDVAARLARHLDGADWVVDALLGTGARGEPRPPLDTVIDTVNAHPASRLAVDIPSGVNGVSGECAQHTFRADHTCTFVAVKRGMLTTAARAAAGQVHVVDIGVPARLLAQFGLRPGHSEPAAGGS